MATVSHDVRKGMMWEILTKLPELLLDLYLCRTGGKLEISIVIAGQIGLDHGAWMGARNRLEEEVLSI